MIYKEYVNYKKAKVDKYDDFLILSTKKMAVYNQ